MQNIVVHDTRLDGDGPAGSITVNERSSLPSLLSNLLLRSAHDPINRLAVMCHGYEPQYRNGRCGNNTGTSGG